MDFIEIDYDASAAINALEPKVIEFENKASTADTDSFSGIASQGIASQSRRQLGILQQLDTRVDKFETLLFYYEDAVGDDDQIVQSHLIADVSQN